MGKAPLNYIAEALQTKSDQFHGELVSLSYLQALATGIVNRIEELDRVKKALFYGRPFQPGPHNYDCTHLPTFINGPEGQCQVAVDLIHGIIGKVTESGELLEALVKCMRGDAQLDLVNLAEEIGDGHWYDAIICAALGTSFEQVQQTNIDKLRARFPNKFTEFDANNRDLGVEREILEGTQGLTAAEHPFAVKVAGDGKGQIVATGFAINDPDPQVIGFHDHHGRYRENKMFKDGTFEHWIDGKRIIAFGTL